MASTITEVERKFARRLASNELKYRNKALKRLKLYISARSKSQADFSAEEMLKLWKGLYFCMWMSDKPLVQEDLADNMATLVDCFSKPQQGMEFVGAFYRTMAREWGLIDKLRMDKFLMLIRKYFHHSLDFLKRHKWKDSLVSAWSSAIRDHLLNPTKHIPSGLQNHMADIFVPELKKVADVTLTPEILTALLEPFLNLMACTSIKPVHACLKDGLFPALIRTTETMILMLRDGKQPSLLIDCGCVSEQFMQHAVASATLGRNRKSMYDLKTRFLQLAEDVETARLGSSEVSQEEGEEPLAPPPKKKKKDKKKKNGVAKALDFSEDVDGGSDVEASASDSTSGSDAKAVSAGGKKKKKTEGKLTKRKLRKRLTTKNVAATPVSEELLSEDSQSGGEAPVVCNGSDQLSEDSKSGGEVPVVCNGQSLANSDGEDPITSGGLDQTPVPKKSKKVKHIKNSLRSSTGMMKSKRSSPNSRTRRVSFTAEKSIQQFQKTYPVSPHIKPDARNIAPFLSPEGLPRGILKRATPHH